MVSFFVRSSARDCSRVTTGTEERSKGSEKAAFPSAVTYMTSWCSRTGNENIESVCRHESSSGTKHCLETYHS